MNKFLLRVLIILAVIAVNIGADQFTKYLAIEHLKGQPNVEVVGDIFILTYAENTGAFLSLGAGIPEPFHFILIVLLPSAAMVAFLAYVLLSKKLNWLQIVLLSTVIGGGVGNLYDRIVYGYVVDFMNFGLGSLRTGVLNVADISLTFGAIILFITFMKAEKEEKERNENKTSSEAES